MASVSIIKYLEVPIFIVYFNIFVYDNDNIYSLGKCIFTL